MSFIIKKAVFPICVLSAVIFLTFYCIGNNYKTKTEPQGYVLKSYKNTVAIYLENTPVKIYDNIILNTLPASDIKDFNNGINFENITDAEKYLEDFD